MQNLLSAVYLFLLLLPSLQLEAQSCEASLGYLPDETSRMLHVNVNMIFLQSPEEGAPKNFTIDGDGYDNSSGMTGVEFAQAVIDQVNWRLADNPQNNLPPGNGH